MCKQSIYRGQVFQLWTTLDMIIQMATEIYKLQFDQQGGLTQTNSMLNNLAEDEVRIQILFTGISKNDLLFLDGKHKHGYFGVQTVGKVVAAGKNVGRVKVNDIVGVYQGNANNGEVRTGFSSQLQVNQNDVVYVPNSISPEYAASLLGAGVIAFNALQKIPSGNSIAVVGTGVLAYLTTQYAKKVFNFKVTLFGYDVTAELAQSFGADGFHVLSNQNINKHTEEYHHIILTDVIKQEEAVFFQNIAYRTGRVIVAIDMGYNPEIKVFDMVCSQREFLGVKRGSYGQIVRALEAAAFYGVRANIEVFNFADYTAAFQRAREANSVSVVLKY